MRSVLVVPGDCVRKLEAALRSEADALVIALDQPAAQPAKSAARHLAAEVLRRAGDEAMRPLVYLRIHDLATGGVEADLAGFAGVRLDGIVLGKTVGGADLQRLGARLAVWEAETGIADGRTRILAVAASTARGLLAMGTLPGASLRLAGLAWGAEDLAADLGAETIRGETGGYAAPCRHARMMTLLTARAAEVIAIDTAYADLGDPEHFRRLCRMARRDGFAAKMAVHPAQIPIINDTFAP